MLKPIVTTAKPNEIPTDERQLSLAQDLFIHLSALDPPHVVDASRPSSAPARSSLAASGGIGIIAANEFMLAIHQWILAYLPCCPP